MLVFRLNVSEAESTTLRKRRSLLRFRWFLGHSASLGTSVVRARAALTCGAKAFHRDYRSACAFFVAPRSVPALMDTRGGGIPHRFMTSQRKYFQSGAAPSGRRADSGVSARSACVAFFSGKFAAERLTRSSLVDWFGDLRSRCHRGRSVWPGDGGRSTLPCPLGQSLRWIRPERWSRWRRTWRWPGRSCPGLQPGRFR